ncbi:MAG: NAD(P)H-dependent glycerol-3-phosphate dehydrogenase, partial [Candidatus Rokuibacteriota bacterium]
MRAIAIVGAGSWGTALAAHGARLGGPVRLWARSAEVAAAIRATGRNPWYLADVELGQGIEATTDIAQVVE